MTRVSSAATAARAQRSVSSAIAKRAIDKKQYKVEYKLVTVQKKQLKISNNPPPPTYSFVAAGSEAFTNYCKDICRRTRRTVHVSQSTADPTRRARVVNDPNRVGYYIGRDGFYFPNDVIQKACNWFGVRIDQAGKTTEPNDYLSTRVRDALGRHGQRDERQQIEAALREMFPKIPQEAARRIIEHAFESAPQPGQKQRVGNARDLDLAGRVQLAVNAHIRHLYTNYDELLRQGAGWHVARAAIGPTCVAILKNWMDEDDVPELEETFQEWIDLRDDEEDDEDSSSIEGTSDLESRRRTSINGIHTIHKAPPGLSGPSHVSASAHNLTGADLRMVYYRKEPDHILPSVESHIRLEQGPRRPFSQLATPHALLHDPPPPPAPSPPICRAPPSTSFERHPPAAIIPRLRRIEPERSVHPQELVRTAPREYKRDVVDLTTSPIFSRSFRYADHAPRYTNAPTHPAYGLPQQGALPRAVAVGLLRGGEGDPRDIHRGHKPVRSAVNATRPVAYDSFLHNDSERHPLMARNNRSNEHRLPPPSNMASEPPHPAVPRTGWVSFPSKNRLGEAVR